ncbi:MAG: FadR family transcriptional regulator [Cyclobacteriaceae bacterium]|nr:FadR family transcriptional regulator [Cyclobacteriaceae bacterium]
MKLTLVKKSVEESNGLSLVDQVESQLVELLRQKKLRVGDSIPREVELAELLGVSRTVIREALLRLRVMGLISSRRKKGAVITRPDIFSIMHRSMNPHILDQDTLRELFELRLMLEIGMADFIYQRISAEDIIELRAIVAMEADTGGAHVFSIEQEIAFHSKLYEISGNDSLKKFQKMLLPLFDFVHHSGLLKIPAEARKFVSHKGLVDILENGSPELFRNAMRNHLENHFIRLF